MCALDQDTRRRLDRNTVFPLARGAKQIHKWVVAHHLRINGGLIRERSG